MNHTGIDHIDGGLGKTKHPREPRERTSRTKAPLLNKPQQAPVLISQRGKSAIQKPTRLPALAKARLSVLLAEDRPLDMLDASVDKGVIDSYSRSDAPWPNFIREPLSLRLSAVSSIEMQDVPSYKCFTSQSHLGVLQ